MTSDSDLVPGQADQLRVHAAGRIRSSADAKALPIRWLWIRADAAVRTIGGPSVRHHVRGPTSRGDGSATRARADRPSGCCSYAVTNKGGSAEATVRSRVTVPRSSPSRGLTTVGWACTPARRRRTFAGPRTLNCVPDAPLAKDSRPPLDIPVIVMTDDLVIHRRGLGAGVRLEMTTTTRVRSASSRPRQRADGGTRRDEGTRGASARVRRPADVFVYLKNGLTAKPSRLNATIRPHSGGTGSSRFGRVAAFGPARSRGDATMAAECDRQCVRFGTGASWTMRRRPS